MSRLTFSAYVTRMGSQRTLWWTSPRSYKRVSIACIAAVACLLSGCSAEAKTTSTEEKDVLSAESVMTSVSGNIYEGVVTEPVETGYWSIPLEETYLKDPYKLCKGNRDITRYEMLASGEAWTRQTLNDMFHVDFQLGYLKEVDDELKYTRVWEDVGADSDALFSWAIMLTPCTEIPAAERHNWGIKNIHEISEYADITGANYQIRVVDIYGNVVNTDWETVWRTHDPFDYVYETGGGTLQALEWHTDGVVPVENIDYAEVCFFGLMNADGVTIHPVFDYVVQVKNVYCKNNTQM